MGFSRGQSARISGTVVNGQSTCRKARWFVSDRLRRSMRGLHGLWVGNGSGDRASTAWSRARRGLRLVQPRVGLRTASEPVKYVSS